MARVMAQAGRVVSVVLLVLVMTAVGVLSIYGLAGSADGPVTTLDPVESCDPVVLSETREELTERRGPHQRVWRVTRQIEVMDRRTREVSVEEVSSTIVEVGNGLCYQDAMGHWQASEPTWRAASEGFVLERAGYTLRIGRTIDSWLEYGIEADTVRLRPTAIMASDGAFLQEVGGLDPGAEGRVDPNDPACLVFAGAFGTGIDLELQAAPGGYHQNVIFHEKPPLSEPLDPVTTQILVYTELDLGEDDAAGVLDVAAGKAQRQCTTEITCTAPTDDDLVLVKHVAMGDGLYEYDLCRFADSVVSDRASRGRAQRTLAAKQVLRDEKTGSLYLVESLDHAFFAEAEYPVVWDYQTVTGTLATDTTWYAASTYYVSDDLTIDHCALRIEPGTFVKVAAGKKITTRNRGTLIARGKPGRRIVFVCASDTNNGEEISGAASGAFAGLEVGDGSALEWCHIYSAATGVTIKGRLAMPFQHSRVLGCGTGIEIATEDPNGCRVFNNIINACTAYGLLANTANGTAAVVNNTFYNNATAIRLGPSCRLDMQILNNLILSCSGVGIDSDSLHYDPNDPSNPSDPNDSVLVLDYNGYHGNTVNTAGVGAGLHDVQTLVSPLCSPSGSSADWVSFYYLNTDPNGGGLLADAGNTEISGWILNDPNLGYQDPNQWSIYMMPEDNVRGFFSATAIDTDTVWQPSYATCDTGTVAIGYHHPRVDYYICKADVTVNATLEILPGTVIAQAVDGATGQGRLATGSTGSLICRGDPFEGGYITFVERGRAGEMAGVGIPWLNERPFVELTSGCAYDVQFTRFVGLGYALVCHEGQGVLRDCQFLLNNRGIDYRSCVGAECANGLFMNNYIAVRDYEGTGGVIRNCTFATNSRCINLAGSAVADATVYNCLFHSYNYGLRINNSNCILTEHHNAFYHENGGTFYPIYPAESHDLDPNDWADPLRDYAQGLYGDPYDPSWPDFDLRFCLVADSNAVDNGYDPAGRGMCGYTVFLANIEDTGVIDIGFHRPLPGDLDSDDLRDFEEYWQGTDPNNPDSDYDGLYDGPELTIYGTDPLNWDSDSDGLPDGWEVDNGLDPLDSSGLNGWDGDPDGDGHTNGVEYLHGSKANDAQSLPEPTVITVGYGVATIQQAIDNSIHDDLIEVPPGVYNEAIDFKGKRIIVSNLSAAYGYWSLVEQTIIDAGGLSSPAVTFSEGDDPSGLLFGVTVRGGTVGVRCTAAAEPWILNCLITSNEADGIHVMAGSPCIASSKVLGNGAHGIYISGGQAQVLNNWIDGNEGDGIQVADTVGEPGVEIRNNTITNNETIGIRSDAEVSPAISNCILWGNDVNDLQGCAATYSCIERGHLGEGNIAADPRLIDLGYGPYILDPNSPCIDAGDPSAVGEGELDLEAHPRLFGVTVDIGACEFSPTAMADRRLPYMTSFEGCQGYTYWRFWGDLRGQDGWRVPDGHAWVYAYLDYTTEDWLGRHPIVQAAFIDANSIVSRTFVSVGEHHRHVRCTISPWYGAEVRVVNGDNTVAAVRFGSDRNLYIYNGGQFENTEHTWYYPGCEYWSSPDMPWGRELHLVLDYGTNSYKVYYGGQQVADADFAQPFSTLTEFQVRSGYGFIGLDRVSISDEPLGDLQLSITQPCACEDDEIEGRIAVKGKLWWDRLGLYQLAYCPASWIEREEDLLDQWRWTIFDTGGNVVPNGGTLGYWDTTAIPNGYYYLGVIVYSDSGVASIHVLTKELYYHGQLIYADWAPVAVNGELKSGAFAHREAPDVTAPWPGQFPFELTRSYNSMNRFQKGPFGLGWTHNWDVYLVEDTRFHYHRAHDTGTALWAAHDDGGIGLGQVYVRYPDGSSKLFVCKNAPGQEGLISPAKYVPRATEDTSGEYLLRTTTISANDSLESIRYTLYTRDGTELVFETGSLVDQDITPPPVGGGAVDWAAKATLKRMEDRFGNAVELTWNQSHTLVTQISNGRHAILLDPDVNDHYERVRLYRVADVNEPAQLLQTVEYGVDYDCLRTVSRPGKGVDTAGRMGLSTTEHITGYGYYYAGQLISIEYDYHALSYAPDIEILYDEAGRMVWRRDYLSAHQGTDTEYDYSYYHPFPNAPTQEQRELSYLATTRTVYDSAFHNALYYDDLTGIEPLHRVIAVHDDKGNLVGHYPRPFDVLPVTDVNSIFTYTPNGRLSDSETTERFDGYARRTWRAYDLATGDVTEERVYVDPTHYAATEYAYHSIYPFPVRQTSWQDYNKTGRKIEALFFYGRADGTIDPNDEAANKYLVGQEVFLEDAGSSDPNDWRFAQTTYTYYDDGRVRTVTDPDGFVTLYGYDEYGNQAEVWIGTTDPFSGPPDQRIRYDALGRAVLSTNRRGAVTLSQYDDFGRLCRELRYEDPNAVLITYADFAPARYFDPNSSPDPNAVGPYDPNEVTLADYGPFTPVAAVYYGYDAKGRRTYERKATGGTVVTTYTRSGLPETVTYDDGSLIQYGYTGTGQKRWEGYDLDGDGFDWDVSTWYDLLDRPTEEVYWAAADSDAWLRGRWRAYWGSGQTALELDYGPGDWTSGCDDERVVFYEYDVLGRPVRQVVDPNDGGLQLATEYAYDAAGNRIRTTDPKGRHIHVGYDNANRAIWRSFATEVTDPNLVDVRSRTCYHPNGKISAELAYDYDGSLLARSDFAYDDHGRVSRVVEWITAAPDPNDWAVTEYAYSDEGFTVGGQSYHIRITDAEDKETYIALDPWGRRVKTLYPSGDYEEVQYNGDGTLHARAVWDGSDVKRWITYAYDGYGRRQRVTYPDEGYVEFSHDGFGRRTGVYDQRNAADNIGGNHTITWVHDALGRVTQATDQDGYAVLYTYRGDGQRSSIRVIEPTLEQTLYHVVYLYDAAGRLEAVAEPLRGLSTPWIATLGYDDNGNRSQLAYRLDGTLEGDVCAIGYAYNADNLLTGFSTTGGPTFSLSNVTVDGLGRLIEADESLIAPGGSPVTHTLDYTYDMRSQLTSASMTNIGGSTWTAGWTYDKAGNIASQMIDQTPTSFTYDGDLMTAKGQDSLDWDLNGRLVSGIDVDMTHDPEGKLRSASSGGTTLDLAYEPVRGMRIRRDKTVGQSTTCRKYIVDTQARLPIILLELDPDESDPNDGVVGTYVYVHGQIVAQHAGHYESPMYFYLHDRLGSVRQVIDTGGSVRNTYTYDPWGQPFTIEAEVTVDNPFLFTGQYFDAEINQYYLRARQYDPQLYRFTSRDPIRGRFTEPLELHRYLYCLNEPVNRLDLDGRFSFVGTALGVAQWAWQHTKDAGTKVYAGTRSISRLRTMATLANATISGVMNMVTGPRGADEGKLFLSGFIGGAIEIQGAFMPGVGFPTSSAIGHGVTSALNHMAEGEGLWSLESAIEIAVSAGMGGFQGKCASMLPQFDWANQIKYYLTLGWADSWMNVADALGDMIAHGYNLD